MSPDPHKTRGLTAATTAVVLAAMIVAVPLLDRGADPGALALSDPAATVGYVDHHHGVCLQHSASAWSPTALAEFPIERCVQQTDSPSRALAPSSPSLRLLHHSRAPPLV